MARNRSLAADLGKDMAEGEIVRLLEFIEDFWGDHGQAPTNRELAEGLGLTSGSVAWYWVEAAMRRGLLTKAAGKKRSLELTFAGRRLLAGYDQANRTILQERISYHEERVTELEARLAEL